MVREISRRNAVSAVLSHSTLKGDISFWLQHRVEYRVRRDELVISVSQMFLR
jgi:hypothetical protein